MQSTVCRAPAVAPVCRTCIPKRAFAPAAAPVSAPRRALRCQAAATGVQAATKYPAWEAIHAELVNKYGTRTLTAEEAFDMTELGQAVLIDVRPGEEFDKGHPKGAVNVPAFVVIDAPSSPGEWGKWLACKANGVTPTKPNAELTAQIAAAAQGSKAVILACEAGGTLVPSVNFPQGKVSRSLKAAWKVLATGSLPAERVMHLDGGVFSWFKAQLPMVGEYDGSGAGRTPNTAEKPSGDYINGQ